ncbi:MAG: phospholipase D-like domain-containing protein, partial [Bdellovibrionota bacterium]
MRIIQVFSILCALVAVACTHLPDGFKAASSPPVAQITRFPSAAIELPVIKNYPGDGKEIEALLKKNKVPADKMQLAKSRIKTYFDFLGVDPRTPEGNRIVDRIFLSSTMFLFCDSDDWECLEQKPFITPSAPYRREVQSDLGSPVRLSRGLNLKYFFTEQYTLPAKSRNPQTALANDLAQAIEQDWDSLSMAIFGIDDINGTMKRVYQAIVEKRKQGATVTAVVDNDGFPNKLKPGKVLFSHRGLQSGDSGYTKSQGYSEDKMSFQYDGTLSLMKEMNGSARSESDTTARLEWPDSGIMHNKFFVFKKGSRSAVWSGTANISQTCMGDETNANMAVLVEDNDIANAFETEFEEMHTFSKKPYKDPKKQMVTPEGKMEIPIGSFHKNKIPNTKRYFIFNDGTEVRLHFSPTDDAEHRVIIPMLFSAQPGDEFRIAMFGSGGIELVRAMQFAASKGASVKIVFDKMAAEIPGSLLKTAFGNILEKNPYDGSKTNN